MNTGGLPRQYWVDRRNDGPFPAEGIVKAAVLQNGFVNPFNLGVALAAMDWPEEQQRRLLNQLALAYVERMIVLATRPQAISGCEGLQPYLDAFSRIYPWCVAIIGAMYLDRIKHRTAVFFLGALVIRNEKETLLLKEV